jgi:hypothetical protein
MKIIILFLAVIILHPTLAMDWDEFNGCYKTVQFNDVYLDNNENNYSVINLNENPLFVISPDEGEYLVHSVLLYKGLSEDYFYQDIFVEDGTTSQVYGELINSFKSFVRYRFDPDKILSIANEIRVKKVNESDIEITAYYKLKHLDQEVGESGHFILSKIDCYDEIETEKVFTKGLKLPVDFSL